MPTIFFSSLPEAPTRNCVRFTTRRDSMNHVLLKGCSQRTRVDWLWTWSWRQEFLGMIHSRAGSCAGCLWEEQEELQEELPLQVYSSSHRKQAKGGNLDIQAPKQFLVHAHTTIHACRHMGFDGYSQEAKVALKSMNLYLDIAKSEYSTEKKRQRNTRRNLFQVLRLCLP